MWTHIKCFIFGQDAQDSFNDWFEHYHNSKPTPPDIPQGSNFTERVAYEHKEKQYQADLDRWKHSLKLQTTVSDFITFHLF